MNRTTQRHRVAQALLRDIRTGRYRVGDRLPSERELALEFEVSRPIIREALGMLSMLEMVETQMGRGAFVTSNDVSAAPGREDTPSLIDIVDVREVLESGALRLARRRAGEAEKKAIADVLDRLEAQVATGQETAETDLELHRQIVTAAKSPTLTQLWTDLNDRIAETIRVSPHGRRMSDEILAHHRTLAQGVTEGDVDAAQEACRILHEDNRSFLRRLVG
jgi:GntR family transcriptional repressor for pyruvate dehydrogenase complex